MPMPDNAWRRSLRQASFRGVAFKVEAGGQAGGRRGPEHEFPKRDTPFAEDTGRKARRWQIAAYIIGPDYISDRDALIAACEQEGPGTLVHPTLGEHQAKCDGYATSESREQGGICRFELLFSEAGSLDANAIVDDTQSQVASAATTAESAASTSLDASLSQSLRIGSNGLVTGPV